MTILGQSILKNKKKVKLLKEKLTEELALIMGVERNDVEMVRPSEIKSGLILKLYVYGDTDVANSDCAQQLRVWSQNGDLSLAVQKGWKLPNAPIIGSIESKDIESKQERKNTDSATIEMVEGHLDNNQKQHQPKENNWTYA